MNLSSFYFHDPIEITAASFCTAMVRFGRRKKAYPPAPLLCLDVARRARPQRGPYLYTSLYQPIPLPEGTTREEVWNDMPAGVPMIAAPRGGFTWESAMLQMTPDGPVTPVQMAHNDQARTFRLSLGKAQSLDETQSLGEAQSLDETQSLGEGRNGDGGACLLFSYGEGVTATYLLHLRSFSVTATARFQTVPQAGRAGASEAQLSDANGAEISDANGAEVSSASEAQQPYALEVSQTFRKLAEAAAWIHMLTVAPATPAVTTAPADAAQAPADAPMTTAAATPTAPADDTKKQEATLPPASENLADMLDSLHASGLLSTQEWEEKKRQLTESKSPISD